MEGGPESSRPGTTYRQDSVSDDGPQRSVGETLRRARKYRGWSLREVGSRIDRPNAYLSQIERGVIRQPDPGVIWKLAQLYDLDFTLLAQWLGLTEKNPEDARDVTGRLMHLVLNLNAQQKIQALTMLEELEHRTRT